MTKWANLLCVVFVGLISSLCQAAIIHPGSLNPGDQYRYAFVTSTSRDATSSDIADYDAHVNAAIAAVDPGGTGLASVDWRAWGSTSAIDARDHIFHTAGDDTVPFFLLGTDTAIATNRSDLLDEVLDAPINTTEVGSELNTSVWTGTNPNGIGAIFEEFGRLSSVIAGQSGATNGFWSFAGDEDIINSFSVYGFSDVITVSGSSAVPEPSSMAMAVLGLGVFGFVHLRRRKTQKA